MPQRGKANPAQCRINGMKCSAMLRLAASRFSSAVFRKFLAMSCGSRAAGVSESSRSKPWMPCVFMALMLSGRTLVSVSSRVGCQHSSECKEDNGCSPSFGAT